VRGVLGGANVCFPQLDLDTFLKRFLRGWASWNIAGVWNSAIYQRRLPGMKRLVRIVGLAVAVSLLAGLAMYGLVRAMYKLAHTLSLSPALTNLAPLAALAVLCFIAPRFVKYFQRRAEHRRVVQPLATETLTRNKYEERRQAWLQIKAKGRSRYVWRTGVIGWGLPVFAIFTPLMLILNPGTHPWFWGEIAGISVFSFLVWMLAGYFFGRLMWKTLDKRYR